MSPFYEEMYSQCSNVLPFQPHLYLFPLCICRSSKFSLSHHLFGLLWKNWAISFRWEKSFFQIRGFFSFYFPRICLSSPPCLSSDIAYEIFLNGTFAYFFFSDMEFYKNKTVVTLFAPPSTPDFSGEVGLNLALGLVTSCCSCHTAWWRPACCWLG